MRSLESAGFPGVWATLVFNLLPLLLLLPALFWRRRAFTPRNWRFHINGMLIGVSVVLYASSFVYTEVVRAVLLFYLTPVWGFVLGRIFLADPITPIRWCSVLLGMVGMLVILGIDSGIPWPSNSGDWMAIASGLVWSVASLRMLLDTHNDAINYTIAFFFWCSVFSIVIASAATFIGVLALPDWSELGRVAVWFLPVALFLLIPGSLAVVYSASKLNPGVVGVLFMVEVCVATITAAVLTDETFGAREVIGVVLIMLAGVVEPLLEAWRSRSKQTGL